MTIINWLTKLFSSKPEPKDVPKDESLWWVYPVDVKESHLVLKCRACDIKESSVGWTFCVDIVGKQVAFSPSVPLVMEKDNGN